MTPDRYVLLVARRVFNNEGDLWMDTAAEEFGGRSPREAMKDADDGRPILKLLYRINGDDELRAMHRNNMTREMSE